MAIIKCAFSRNSFFAITFGENLGNPSSIAGIGIRFADTIKHNYPEKGISV
jgi:hypothetical protein